METARCSAADALASRHSCLALNPIFGARRWPTQHRRGIDRNRLADKLFTLVRVVGCDHITPLGAVSFAAVAARATGANAKAGEKWCSVEVMGLGR